MKLKINMAKKSDLIINICKKLGASHYLNLPGGKNIYSKQNFENKIKLEFLDNYFGSYDSILNELYKLNFFSNSVFNKNN